MGKGQRSRLARADEMAAKKVAAKKKARQEKIVKITSIITAIVLIVGLAGMIVYTSINDANRKNGTYLKKDIAVESASYQFNNAQLMYFFQNYYANFMQNNEQYLQYYGLDTEKSLKEQTSPYTNEDGSSQSWYEYFMNGTVAQMEQTLVLAETAKEAGFKLSDEEVGEMEETLKNITPETFAPGLTKEEMRACMEVNMLASSYQTKVQDGIEYTDADLEKFYKDNKNDYDVVDYRMYSFSYDDEDEEKANRTDAKKLADELAATGNEEGFVNWLRNYFTDTLKTKAENIESELNNTKSEGFPFTDSYVGNDFLFGASSKAGDIKIVEDTEGKMFKVFLLLKPRGRMEDATKSVRHILISVEDMEDADLKKKAKAEADKLLADWAKGEATEQSFAALVHDNTDDPGSKETGGLYEGFARGEMVEAFENWSYDAARKPGDTGIVETEYGYHVMYFVGDGDVVWKKTAKENYVAEKYSAEYEAFAEKHAVTVNDKNVGKIASYIN